PDHFMGGAHASPRQTELHLLEPRPRGPDALQRLLDLLRDNEGDGPPPRADDLGIPYLRGIDAHAGHGSVLAGFLRAPILWHPMLHLLGRLIIDAPQQTGDVHEAEVI